MNQQETLHPNEILGLGQTGMVNHIPNSNLQVSKNTQEDIKHLFKFQSVMFLLTEYVYFCMV